MIEFLLNWLDALWLLVAVFLLRKDQKLKAVLFVLACMLLLRFQLELFSDTGYGTGFLPLIDTPVLYRGYAVYGLFTALFLFLGHVSKEPNTFIYMAAAISVLTVAFCVSLGVMAL